MRTGDIRFFLYNYIYLYSVKEDSVKEDSLYSSLLSSETVLSLIKTYSKDDLNDLFLGEYLVPSIKDQDTLFGYMCKYNYNFITSEILIHFIDGGLELTYENYLMKYLTGLRCIKEIEDIEDFEKIIKILKHIGEIDVYEENDYGNILHTFGMNYNGNKIEVIEIILNNLSTSCNINKINNYGLTLFDILIVKDKFNKNELEKLFLKYF